MTAIKNTWFAQNKMSFTYYFPNPIFVGAVSHSFFNSSQSAHTFYQSVNANLHSLIGTLVNQGSIRTFMFLM